uniref:Uncharacterized protein n=1 Tax=viral metagenome TaxID=1070528 RepID=A0A6C0JAG8_9ZZZZ
MKPLKIEWNKFSMFCRVSQPIKPSSIFSVIEKCNSILLFKNGKSITLHNPTPLFYKNEIEYLRTFIKVNGKSKINDYKIDKTNLVLTDQNKYFWLRPDVKTTEHIIIHNKRYVSNLFLTSQYIVNLSDNAGYSELLGTYTDGYVTDFSFIEWKCYNNTSYRVITNDKIIQFGICPWHEINNEENIALQG